MLKNMSRHCIRNARRFEHKASLQAMLAKAGRSSLAQYPGTIPGGIQLSLQGYPSQIKALWSSLEGKDIRELLTDFLLTLEVPVQPSPASRQAFYESWFAHY
jgi:hypothetical protein